METGPSRQPSHSFHIPVMGTGFTIDTPLKVARYGISSVISLVDDVLIEQVRAHHAKASGELFVPIASQEDDCRARRITAYLDLAERLVLRQVEALRTAPFDEESEITRYFEMLPEGPARQAYERMRNAPQEQRLVLQASLRESVRPGRIEANIMTKLDRDRGDPALPQNGDAMSALRGFARSSLAGALVLSAGMNTRLFAYAASFPEFCPDEMGRFRKPIVLKVSDLRSAEIQGRYLAKRGLWVSEYRVESGLNCGGHAFPTQGLLLGPILEEFKANLTTLHERQLAACRKAWQERGRPAPLSVPPLRLTVQGGIGTCAEDRLLREAYGAHGTGWGTPFLLVPEATNVDEDLLQRLASARPGDIRLSNSSPLGVPYWNLMTSSSETSRTNRVKEKRPGSSCPKGYLALNQEFGTPLCVASHTYQSRKLKELRAGNCTPETRRHLEDRVLEKACICHELSGGVRNKHALQATRAAAAVCPGPNLIHFHRPATLQEMADHIYGRTSLIEENDRPHLFLNELSLYVDYLAAELKNFTENLSNHTPSFFAGFKQNLLAGIEYYDRLARRMDRALPSTFLSALNELHDKLVRISVPAACCSAS